VGLEERTSTPVRPAGPDVATFGLPCFRGTLAAARDWTIDAATDRAGGYVCLMNVHVLETALHDAEVASVLERARVVFPDGAPIAWLQRRRHGSAERVGGPDLMAAVLSAGRGAGLRHAFYGSTRDVLDLLEQTVEERYPGVEIVGSIAPPFGSRDQSELDAELDELREADPHIVWVALGAPRQELWAALHAAALTPALVVCVGAAFAFLSGSKNRAPRWMQTHGLEWLHRLATEPRRLGGRYVRTNARFVVRAAADVLRVPVRRVVP
jgi:N-acetylglucosaminyldiphosphoundecaprenol N-acetyl-beta-D-mannosaminyltransferase